jgi:hypothetical protein
VSIATTLPFTENEALGTYGGPLPVGTDREEYEMTLSNIEADGLESLEIWEIKDIEGAIKLQKSGNMDTPPRGDEGDKSLTPNAKPPETLTETQDVKPGEEIGETKDASGCPLEALAAESEPTEESVETPQPQPDAVETKSEVREEQDKGDTKASSDETKKEKWLEGPLEWLEWSFVDTREPKPRNSLDEFRQLIGPNKIDPKARGEFVWHREVARTYYYKEKFWYLNDTGKWYSYPKTDLLNIVEGADLFLNRPADRGAGSAWVRAKTNAFLRRIQTKNVADFVGELPGYMPGLYTHKGRTFLIINGPDLIEPVPGDYKPALDLLLEVLGEEETEYLIGWLKTGDKCLRTGDRSSGQMLIIGGKKDSGKTFLKEHIIRPILGGRHADPSDYLKGGKFNADIFKAESWEIDDGVGTKEKRQILTGAVKKMTATSEHRIEGKYVDGVQPPPMFIRLHAYVNTDSESDLFAIPEVTDSIRDKLIILHADQSKHERQKTILPDATVEGARETFVEQIRAALPAFIHYFQARETPEKYRSARYGVAPYVNPELEKVLHKASDEGRQLALIDKLVFTHLEITEDWEGTEEEMENIVAVSARDTNQTQDLNRVKWKSGAWGEGLAKLADVRPDRVKRRPRKHGGVRGWIISPPEGHVEYILERGKQKGKMDYTKNLPA